MNFAHITELTSWLDHHHIDTSRWGIQETKSLSTLWQEYLCGETKIRCHPPRRMVDVVVILLRRNGTILVELEQELYNTARRKRFQPPCEKLFEGENYLSAAKRCLTEELGLESYQFSIALDSYRTVKHQSESSSYPGLPSEYSFHILEASTHSMPTTPFWQPNNPMNAQSTVTRHLWAWLNVDAVLSLQASRPWFGVMAHGRQIVSDSYCR